MNIIRTALIASCLFLVNLPIVSAQKENDLDALLADPEAEQSKDLYRIPSSRPESSTPIRSNKPPLA